jgi:hypothetical protein
MNSVKGLIRGKVKYLAEKNLDNTVSRNEPWLEQESSK